MKELAILIGMCLMSACTHTETPKEPSEYFRAHLKVWESICLDGLGEEKVTPENEDDVVNCMMVLYRDDREHLGASSGGDLAIPVSKSQ